ncbi:MAG: TonB-dependent receptor [bacterium]|nr:TonB-dependent receptor [bacterium]
MKRGLVVFLVIMILVFGIYLEIQAKEVVAKKFANCEELLFVKIPTVVSSSKRSQPLTEAASSVVIITAEDIKHSGATNIGDVLRSVAGIDVRESDAAQHVIGVRGFADTCHVLVTMDGNNIFMYHANHIFLDWAPFDLEEINYIEIIKGPGAVFYGGSAFSGVINIVTKTPIQLKETQVNLVGGNWDTVRSNIIHTGSYKNLDYSFSLGHRGAKEWESPKIEQEANHFFVNYFAGKAIYRLDEESSLSLMSRFSDAKNVISSVCQPKTTFISLRYDQSDSWMRIFYNHHKKTFWNDTYGVEDSNCELEFYRTLRWKNNITSFGGYAKKTAWSVEGLKGTTAGNKEKHDVEDYAINMENEHHLNDWFIFTLGTRGEYYSLLNYLALGRGSIIYKPKANQSLRLTVANGYYIPSLFQHTNKGYAYPFALGNPSLNKEKITSYELSHYSCPTNHLKLIMSLFYNNYQDLIDNTQAGPAKNVADAKQYGGELELDFILNNWLSGFANYSYQHIQRDDFGNLKVDPENKFNFGLKAELNKWSGNLAFHYVDKYYEMYLTSNPVFGRIAPDPSKVESYATVDTRIAYHPYDNLELSLTASNLFNHKHYESNSTGWHTGDKIGRKVSMGANYKF